ncbi:hypothetical protein LguiA_006736 [Lonicera macranthoides]
MGVDLVPKVKQEICETAKVQESSTVTDLKVNMVINMYSKYGLVGYTCKVFNGIPEMVVAGNMDVLECACEFFSRPEADTNELRTALTETKQIITWFEREVVIGYFVLLVFDSGGNKLITLIRRTMGQDNLMTASGRKRKTQQYARKGKRAATVTEASVNILEEILVKNPTGLSSASQSQVELLRQS